MSHSHLLIPYRPLFVPLRGSVSSRRQEGLAGAFSYGGVILSVHLAVGPLVRAFAPSWCELLFVLGDCDVFLLGGAMRLPYGASMTLCSSLDPLL